MKLYDKGKYGHIKILNYIRSDMDMDIPQCKYCLKTNCINCPEALQSDYIAGYVVHKLYYTLFLMAKSYIAQNEHDNFKHDWMQHRKTLVSLTSSELKKEINKFTLDMDRLKKCRHNVDYKISDHRKDRQSAIGFARSAFSNFQIIKKELGTAV